MSGSAARGIAPPRCRHEGGSTVRTDAVESLDTALDGGRNAQEATGPRERQTGAQLALLGGFALRRAAQEVPVGPALAHVLALVAVRGGRAGKVEVAQEIWPGKARSRTLANLRSVLWRLPEGAWGMLRDEAGFLMLADDVRVDIAALADGVDIASGAAAALALPLLPGWYEDWVILAREDLARRQLAVLEDLAERELDRGRAAAAIQVALLAISIEPFREAAHRLVIRAHLAEGNVAEAVEHLGEITTLFADELGAPPSPLTVELLLPYLRDRDCGATPPH